VPEVEIDRVGRGVGAILNLSKGEKVTTVFKVRDYAGQELITLTSAGLIKRSDLEGFKANRTTGLIAAKLNDGDFIVACELVDKSAAKRTKIFVGMEDGKCAFFPVSEIPLLQRASKGSHAVSGSCEPVVGMLVIVNGKGNPEPDVVTVSSDGLAKRTPISEFRETKRLVKGHIAMKLREGVKLVGLAQHRDSDPFVAIVASTDKTIKVESGEIRKLLRPTFGSMIMRLEDGSSVVSFGVSKEV
jgi:DNA gyrase subunit A